MLRGIGCNSLNHEYFLMKFIQNSVHMIIFHIYKLSTKIIHLFFQNTFVKIHFFDIINRDNSLTRRNLLSFCKCLIKFIALSEMKLECVC